MKEIKTVGLDLAKNVFHLIGYDQRGKEVMKRQLKRNKMPEFFANLPQCLIGMEACAGAHDWARKFQGAGHEVRLIAPQYRATAGG